MLYRKWVVLFVVATLPACEKSYPNRISAGGHEIGALDFVEGFEAGWAEAQKQSKPALVFFTQHGSPPCRSLAREAFRDEEVVNLSQQFVCILVDVRKEGKTADMFRVEATPTVAVLLPGAQTLQWMEGAVPPKTVIAQMQRVLQMAEAMASQKRL